MMRTGRWFRQMLAVHAMVA